MVSVTTGFLYLTNLFYLSNLDKLKIVLMLLVLENNNWIEEAV
jgi:hypothetical protein